MISLVELEEVLKKYSFTEESISSLLKKRKKRLLTRGNKEKIISILNVLKKNKKLNLIESCPSILVRGKASEIENILKLLETHNLLKLLESCPSILAQGKASEIERILKLLETHNLLKLLESCPYILVEGKASKIKSILKLLETHNLLKLLESCPSILAKGKVIEIENILKLLKTHNLLNLIESCPYILAQGKVIEIENILKLLETHNLLNLIESCPYILAQGKLSEIESILKLLKTHNLLNLIESCPSILAQGKVSEIESILKLLEKINGNIENIGGSYLLDYERIKSIIYHYKEKNENIFYKNCLLYLKLIGFYNKEFSKEDIYKMSKELTISYEDFILNILNMFSIDTANMVLDFQGYLYLGSCQVNKEMLEKYYDTIIEVLATLSKKYYKKMKTSREEARDFFFDILLDRTGNIFINYGSTKYLGAVLFKYLSKCIYQKETYVEYDKVSNYRELSTNVDYDVDNSFINKYSYLSSEECHFLERMSFYIESGFDYLNELQKEFGYSLEEIQSKIENIRTLISSHQELSIIK